MRFSVILKIQNRTMSGGPSKSLRESPNNAELTLEHRSSAFLEKSWDSPRYSEEIRHKSRRNLREKKCKRGLTNAFCGIIILATTKNSRSKPASKSSRTERRAQREPQAVELRQPSPCEWTYEGGRKPRGE